jgi:U3 small nucleolar RNA-associated protein 20
LLDSLKQLATEVLSLLQKETGTTDYVTVYQEVHERIMQNRREKRTNRAIRAVSDPKAHALDRIKKTTAKVNARKRKSHEFSQKRIKTSHSMKLGRK